MTSGSAMRSEEQCLREIIFFASAGGRFSLLRSVSELCTGRGLLQFKGVQINILVSGSVHYGIEATYLNFC